MTKTFKETFISKKTSIVFISFFQHMSGENVQEASTMKLHRSGCVTTTGWRVKARPCQTMVRRAYTACRAKKLVGLDCMNVPGLYLIKYFIDYAKDTSDTDTKSEMSDEYDLQVEYDVVSSEEEENFSTNGSSSGDVS